MRFDPHVLVKRLPLVLLLGLVLPLGTSLVRADDAALDRQLVDSLLAKDIEAARRALDAGADPQAVLGFELADSAMCAAIDDRGTEYLELLLDYGASPDLNTNDGPYALRTPLACAIDLYNPAAFELLLEKGANPDADLCAECAPRFRHSALTQALMSAKLPMALTLVKNSEVDVVELRKILFVLERRPFDSYHPWNDERDALIDWVRAQGVPIDPLAASPASRGHEPPDCVFSTRDLEEGLAEGTICD